MLKKILNFPLHWQILIAVVSAAIIGLSLNAVWSEFEPPPKTIDGKTLVLKDSSNRIDIYYADAKGEPIKGQRWIVDPTGEVNKAPFIEAVAGAVGLASSTGVLPATTTLYPGRLYKTYPTLALLKKDKPAVYRAFHSKGRSLARRIGDWADNIGQLFLRMLKMVSVPLIIVSLMTGILGLANAGRLRKLFGLTIGYYLTTSMLAIFVGLALVNWINPGGRGGTFLGQVASQEVTGDLADVLYQQVEAMIPVNPVEAIAEGKFLSIIAFTLAFGIFTILVGGKTLQVLRDIFHAGFEVMMKMTMAIIRLAPIGVFALMLAATATQGIEVFRSLGFYMLTVFLALVFHATITLPLIVHFVAHRNPWKYAQAMSPALMTAFSSASSNATLPLTISCVEQRAGIDNRVGSFVLPLGATVNMDGTALFEVIAVLFIAQLDPTVNLTIVEQFLIAITALLASIGAAGIPHAGLVMMVIVLQVVGLPADRVGLILAVDRILDMCRTSVNVWSDSCGCAVVARFDHETTEAP